MKIQIGQLIITLHNLLNFTIPDSLKPFIINRDKTDFELRFFPIQEFPYGRFDNTENYNSVMERKRVGDNYFNIVHHYENPAKIIAITDFNGEKIGVYLSREMKNVIEQNPKWITDLLCVDYLFLKQNGIILHSSHISFRNHSILFSAPSGTGKSTQARLWREKFGDEVDVINGDRTGILEEDRTYNGYGLPVAGTSGIYKNRHFPIKAIVLLEQYSENIIEKVSTNESFLKLWPEITMPRDDLISADKISAILNNIVENIPVYKLKCRPDFESVEILYKMLFENN